LNKLIENAQLLDTELYREIRQYNWENEKPTLLLPAHWNCLLEKLKNFRTNNYAKWPFIWILIKPSAWSPRTRPHQAQKRISILKRDPYTPKFSLGVNTSPIYVNSFIINFSLNVVVIIIGPSFYYSMAVL
jgi:hypothetical protein